MKPVSVRVLFVILIAIGFTVIQVQAQTIVATVKVETNDQISIEVREKIPDFKQVLEDYVNSASWTNGEVDVTIPINLEIFIKSATMGSEDLYGVQILISDRSDVQYFDQRCNFKFMRDEFLQHSPNNWTPLTALIDFYVYVLLGDELDKFGKLMGTRYFENAKMVAEQGTFFDNKYIFGWKQRNELIQEILDKENLPFREMKDFYFYGYYFIQDDPQKARQYIREAVSQIEAMLDKNVDHERCKKFLSAHHIEIIDLFKGTEDNSIFTTLMEIDPENADSYQPYMDSP